MTRHGSIQTRLFDTIEAVPAEDWDLLLGDNSLVYSHAFWRIIEQAGLNDFDYRYLLCYQDNGRPIASTTFYTVTTDIAIFAPAPLRRLLAVLRRLLPNLLKLRMIECGTPITINAPALISDRLDPALRSQVLAAIDRVLTDTAARQWAPIIVIRDFQEGGALPVSAFDGLGYSRVHSLPNTGLAVTWTSLSHYQAALKSYFRSKLNKHVERNRRQGISHRLVEDFADLAETLCAQWQVVHEQADEYQREVLSPAFYRRLSEDLGESSRALLFYRDNELVGHALLLIDHRQLRWLYYGRNKVANDGFYIYVVQAIIETAIELGLEYVDMGMTTYPVKKDLGAKMLAVDMLLKSPWPWLNPLIGFFYRMLNSTPAIENREVFKQSGG